MKHKTAPASYKTAEGDPDGTFEAIVAVFGNVDLVGDRIVKGAFTDSLADWAERGAPIPVIWSHQSQDPDMHIGTVLDAEERDVGLWVRAQLDLDAPKAAQVHRLLRGNRVREFSFAYDVEDAEVVDGVNELRRLTLHEVGPTPLGANPATELLAAKAAGQLVELRRHQAAYRKAVAEIEARTDPAVAGALARSLRIPI